MIITTEEHKIWMLEALVSFELDVRDRLKEQQIPERKEYWQRRMDWIKANLKELDKLNLLTDKKTGQQ